MPYKPIDVGSLLFHKAGQHYYIVAEKEHVMELIEDVDTHVYYCKLITVDAALLASSPELERSFHRWLQKRNQKSTENNDH